MKYFGYLLFLGILFAQDSEESYSFTMKEIMGFTNKIRELEQRDIVNTRRIRELESTIKKFDDNLGKSSQEYVGKITELENTIKKLESDLVKKTQEYYGPPLPPDDSLLTQRIHQLEQKASAKIRQIRELESTIKQIESEYKTASLNSPKPRKKIQTQNQPTFKKYNIKLMKAVMCETIEKNKPRATGTSFKKDLGRIYCFSLFNNYTEKRAAIYHTWYHSDQLKAKVRILIPIGLKQSAVSHRDLDTAEPGVWRVDIVTSDLKVLDSIIFEVV